MSKDQKPPLKKHFTNKSIKSEKLSLAQRVVFLKANKVEEEVKEEEDESDDDSDVETVEA